jgi:endoglucanase
MTDLFRTGFVRAQGTGLVDDRGPLHARGVGLGNWLLPEGYMWRFGDDLASPRQIEARIVHLVGAERAASFWNRFRSEFITEVDFAMIAGEGFDHVRLPINSRALIADNGVLVEDGFAVIDRAVDWSERYGLRILLDMHGAPGGQTGTNIDDSPRGIPELFMDAAYRAQTVALWRELALRYRDRESVLGYDLLNEPLPDEWQYRYNDELVTLYQELTSAIREVDDTHLIMYEGSHWATNWAPLRDRFDDNQALQFHRYWCPPDESSIEPYLEARDALDTPIYMGEGGENTPAWIYAATRLYERHGIGWNFWPWKKLATRTSPLSAIEPAGWNLIADPTAQPPADEAWRVLEDFLCWTRCSRDRSSSCLRGRE